MTRTATITIPDAWVTEDGILFMVTNPYLPITRAFDNGNKALAESGYDERITWNPLNDPLTERPEIGFRWVDPAYVAAEQWPVSAVSKVSVEGWVKLYRVNVENLPTETDEQIGESR